MSTQVCLILFISLATVILYDSYTNCIFRTALIENTKEDLENVKNLQNQVTLTIADPKPISDFKIPDYDKRSAKETRNDLRRLGLDCLV